MRHPQKETTIHTDGKGKKPLLLSLHLLLLLCPKPGNSDSPLPAKLIWAPLPAMKAPHNLAPTPLCSPISHDLPPVPPKTGSSHLIHSSSINKPLLQPEASLLIAAIYLCRVDVPWCSLSCSHTLHRRVLFTWMISKLLEGRATSPSSIFIVLKSNQCL